MSENCALDCDQQPVLIPVGGDKILTFTLTSQTTGYPIDITAATEIVAAFLNQTGVVPSALEKKLSTSGVTILSGPGGVCQTTISEAETASLATGIQGVIFKVTLAGITTPVNLQNAINVQPLLFALP
jgi:hypothetical protein